MFKFESRDLNHEAYQTQSELKKTFSDSTVSLAARGPVLVHNTLKLSTMLNNVQSLLEISHKLEAVRTNIFLEIQHEETLRRLHVYVYVYARLSRRHRAWLQQQKTVSARHRAEGSNLNIQGHILSPAH